MAAGAICGTGAAAVGSCRSPGHRLGECEYEGRYLYDAGTIRTKGGRNRANNGAIIFLPQIFLPWWSGLNERIIRLEYTGGRLQTGSVGRDLKVRQLRSRADSARDCLAEVEQGFAIGSAFTDHFFCAWPGRAKT